MTEEQLAELRAEIDSDPRRPEYITMPRAEFESLLNHSEQHFKLLKASARMLRALFEVIEPLADADLRRQIASTRVKFEELGL